MKLTITMVAPVHISMPLTMSRDLCSMELNPAETLLTHRMAQCSRLLKNMIITITITIMVTIRLISKVFIIEAMTMMLATLTIVKSWASCSQEIKYTFFNMTNTDRTIGMSSRICIRIVLVMIENHTTTTTTTTVNTITMVILATMTTIVGISMIILMDIHKRIPEVKNFFIPMSMSNSIIMGTWTTICKAYSCMCWQTHWEVWV
jgi:hypothetical protein